MRLVTLTALAIASGLGLGACESASPSLPDADLTKPMCTGVVYDSCTSNAGCMSMNCHYYSDVPIQVCTQSCSASNPCPMDANGVPGKCNNRGECKPSVANPCHP